MVEIRGLSDKEKELLNAVGRYPTMSLKELINCTSYKRASSISRKLDQFRKQNILYGPLMAGVFYYIAVPVILFFIFKRHIMRGMLAGGLKG